MKYLLKWVFIVPFFIVRAIGALIIMIWHFRLNPVLERGSRGGYFYEPWDYNLKDWLIYGNKPQYRGVK